MTPKTRARFDAELPSIYKTLLVRAIYLVRTTGWGRATYKTAQLAAEELVHEAVLRTLDGRRTWDPDVVPDLGYFLQEAMRSIAYADATSAERKNKSVDELQAKGALDGAAPAVASAEDELDRRQHQQLASDALLNAAGDDATLLKLIEVMLDGFSKAADVAAQTGWPVKEVYAAMRKLRRRLVAAKERGNGHGR